MKEMEELQHSTTTNVASSNDIVFDECELLDDYEDMLSEKSHGEYGIQRDEKSSHELVEMAYDGETPKRIRDGKFGKCHCQNHVLAQLDNTSLLCQYS
jgi:hypothetical protein